MIINSCVIFDRDGTLIEYEPYLNDKSKVKLCSGAIELLTNLKKYRNTIFLHTNQAGVSKNYFSINSVNDCNDKMIELIGLGENIFERICIATEIKESSSSYRKPSTKFGFEILEKYNFKKENMYYIGDNFSDLETAKNIGCNAFGIINRKLKNNVVNNPFNFPTFENLLDLNKFLYGNWIK